MDDVTAIGLEVVIHQNWGNPVRTQEISITAIDKKGKKYSYDFNVHRPDLDLAKDLLGSIAANRAQVPWKFKANGTKIVGSASG